MDRDTKIRINNVVYTLNQVSVCGKKNLDCLLGCIQELEDILKEAPDGEQDQAGK